MTSIYAFSLEELGLLRKQLYNIFFFFTDLARPLVNQVLRRLNRFAFTFLSGKYLPQIEIYFRQRFHKRKMDHLNQAFEPSLSYLTHLLMHLLDYAVFRKITYLSLSMVLLLHKLSEKIG